MEKFKCLWCKHTYRGYPNNGYPLVDGPVCKGCNHHVIQKRMALYFLTKGK